MSFDVMPDGLVMLRLPMGEDDPEKRTIPLPEEGDSVIGAGFRTSHWLVSAIANADKVYRPQPKYTPLMDIDGTNYLMNYADEFVGSQSSAETAAIKARIDRRIKDHDTLDKAGGWGVVASIGAGLIDPLNLLPGGTIYKAGRTGATIKSAVSTGLAAGGATAGSDALLSLTQDITLESALVDVGAATLVGGIPDLTREYPDGGKTILPNVQALKALVTGGDLPPLTSPIPVTGNCMAPVLSQGDIAVLAPFDDIEPGDMIGFRVADDASHLVKMFLGVTNCERMKYALNCGHAGTVTVMWMANPETFIAVPLEGMAYATKVAGRFDSGRGFWRFEPWPHAAFAAADLDHYGDSLRQEPLEPFGSPPVAFLPGA